MNLPFISVEQHDAVTILRFDDPAALNAVSAPMIDSLNRALDELDLELSRALVISGTGKAFCAGQKLRDSGAPQHGDFGWVLEHWYNPLINKILRLPLPVITSINGVAAGAGMSLALLGDLSIAGHSASFTQAFIKIGLMPDAGATYLLPRLIGKARAMRLALLGERLSAQQAYDWGLITHLADDFELETETLKLAWQLAEGPTLAMTATRAAYWHSLDSDLASQLNYERCGQAELGATFDAQEGIDAFREKRTPQFRGR